MTDVHEHVNLSLPDSHAKPLRMLESSEQFLRVLPDQRAADTPNSDEQEQVSPEDDRRKADRRTAERRTRQLPLGMGYDVERRVSDRRGLNYFSDERAQERRQIRLDRIRVQAMSDSFQTRGRDTDFFVRVALAGDAVIGAVASTVIDFRTDGNILTLLLCLAVWPLAIWIARGYEARFMGDGAQEFRSVMTAAVGLISTICVAVVAVKADFPRSILITIMVAALATMIWRYSLRQIMHARRRRGLGLLRVLLVGHESAVAELSSALAREQYHGLRVVGACVPKGVESSGAGVLDPNQILGSFAEITDVAEAAQVDAVAVLTCPELDGASLRALVWQLEPLNVDLMVAPTAVEVGGPRLSVRPAAGLPLLHLESPELTGIRRILKSVGDRLGALLLIIAFSPFLIAAALAVRLDSKGPILFRQRRVGLDGHEFPMLKFRSMVPDAEARLAEVAHLNEHEDGRLFKIKDDPRITRSGKFMRRYSIDELPQLFNVLRGEMSLVGPRPPLPAEVDLYSNVTRNRLRVKPGLTGLWQVSGRSSLTPEESARLDLRYVENWSPSLDLMILWKTFRAVVSKDGAY